MALSPEDHLSHLKTRRSRRIFTDKPIPLASLKRAIEAACQAPSGANAQPWEFVLLPRGVLRTPIQEMCREADVRFHENAPPWLKEFMRNHAIGTEKIYFDKAPWLVCVFGRRNLPYWLPSVWLAIANFVNQVEAEGLHTVTYTPTLGKPFNELLGVDSDWSFQAMLPLGYADPEEIVKARPRKALVENTRVFTGSQLLSVDEWEKRSDS